MICNPLKLSAINFIFMKQNTTNKKAYKEKDERNLKMDKIIQFVIKGGNSDSGTSGKNDR